MFYYYGRKKQLARLYPEPDHELIVEPFAGAAAYSLHGDRWRHDVLLIEKDPRVVEIWRWLQGLTREQVEALPLLEPGERSSEFLHIIHAATKMAFAYKTIKVTPVLARNWEISRRVFASNLHKIRHWSIVEGDYSSAPDAEATWFIDPPYQGNPGLGYAFSSAMVDYGELADWILSRKGQVIACESAGATYLPFRPLKSHFGVAGRRSSEAVYMRPEHPGALVGWREAPPSLEVAT